MGNEASVEAKVIKEVTKLNKNPGHWREVFEHFNEVVPLYKDGGLERFVIACTDKKLLEVIVGVLDQELGQTSPDHAKLTLVLSSCERCFVAKGLYKLGG